MSPTFAELGVPSRICRALDARGITTPFEIQAATISDALAGRDVCGRAPTGSGKTIAFGIPLVANSEGRATAKQPTSLVLAPTRELADQIHAELASFAGDVRVGVVYGGVGYGKQRDQLRRGLEILVACPGRLEDLIEQGDVRLDHVTQVVLDEADRMADMGFIPAVRRLLDQTSAARQTVLFSATLDGDVKTLTRDYQRDPVTHTVGQETPDVLAAHHRFWEVERSERAALTARIVQAAWPAIVFTRTRHGADRLAKQLNRAGVDAAPIHGGRSQNQRTRALAGFADGTTQALVATDVAARGIHVDGVACVVHFDPSDDHKTYVHRSGRTARAGRTGVVVSLVEPSQKKGMRALQRHVGLEEPLTEPEPDTLRQLSEQPARHRPQPTEQQGGARTGDRGAGESTRRSRPNKGGGQPRRRTANGDAKRGGQSTRGRNGQQRSRDGSGQKSRDDQRSSQTGSGKPRNKRHGAKAGGQRSGPKGSSRNGQQRNGQQGGGQQRNGQQGGGQQRGGQQRKGQQASSGRRGQQQRRQARPAGRR